MTFVDEVEPVSGNVVRFWRTEIERANQLVNASAWISCFEHVVKHLDEIPKPQRRLQVSLSVGADPVLSMPGVSVKDRNTAAKAMRLKASTPYLPDEARTGFGKQLQLPSGEEILVISKPGPKALAAGQKFRETSLEDLTILAVSSKCPHQGACLNEGELKDVEDLAGTARDLIIRCPWHNKQFNANTGEGLGHEDRLPSYPVRIIHGTLHIGVIRGPADFREERIADPMDVDMEVAPAGGQEMQAELNANRDRSRSRPLRQLRPNNTIF